MRTLGEVDMRDELAEDEQAVNVKHVRRLMRGMCLEPLYPNSNLNKRGLAKYMLPCLLLNLDINRPNQVWAVETGSTIKVGEPVDKMDLCCVLRGWILGGKNSLQWTSTCCHNCSPRS